MMWYKQLVVAEGPQIFPVEISEIGVQHSIRYASAGALEWIADIDTQFHGACTVLAD